jgi:uncharacterized protein (TIGR00251 family)
MSMRYEVTVEFRKDFVRVNGNEIVIGITSKPEKGKANLELIKKLAKYFNVSSSQVRIISGFKSRRKIVEIMERCGDAT